ncbi:MazG nucleotide pyrophosphohydrolase domain-containing protein [Companilactobacillus metriopterae]|uniref:MazG nucleotide pyrophosphohydrolase domain-containing protein n=1 Tax=Companilactobacillus metriopterae TaxID=1909267 RepID=UPI00100C2BC8|nr:MazG nucleotide pyrophosphohydrolase domain-containing protein [Companilactobacillus metriopterae]
MNSNLITLIQEWSTKRGLNKTDPEKQLIKLKEEVQELSDALVNKDFSNKNGSFQDSVGDTLVVLIILCQQTGVDINECLNGAYEEIKDRTGKTVDGVFVKDGKNSNVEKNDWVVSYEADGEICEIKGLTYKRAKEIAKDYKDSGLLYVVVQPELEY